MIRNCKNCGGRISYNIKRQGLTCDNCDSVFSVGEYGSGATDNSSSDMECDIYSCSSCGAELILNNTESSTFCPFCGNATVVMSRVAKIKKPEVIIPFEITAEKAVENIKLMFNNGAFIPDVIHPEVQDLRGIYIPYYVTNVEFDGSIVFHTKSGKKGYPCFRSGYCSANWVTTDASKRLNDTFSQRMEPYFFDTFKTFDEDYLLGFYSDIADVNESDAIAAARTRVMNMAHTKFVQSSKEVTLAPHYYTNQTRFTTEIYDKPVTAMLPAWFYTYTYKGTPYTIAVNGQTGQVSGGVPWSKTKFFTLTSLLMLLIVAITFVPLLFMPTIALIMLVIFCPVILAVIALCLSAKYSIDFKELWDLVLLKNIASSNSLTNFVNKRQEGK